MGMSARTGGKESKRMQESGRPTGETEQWQICRERSRRRLRTCTVQGTISAPVLAFLLTFKTSLVLE